MDENVNAFNQDVDNDTGDEFDSIDLSDVSINGDDDLDNKAPDEQPEADPPKAETQEDTPSVEDDLKGAEGEPGFKPEVDVTFELKHLGEVKAVNRDEVITLAQKGLDYDRVREKYDELKTVSAQNLIREESVDALAKEMGMTTDEFLENAWLGFFKSKGYDDDMAREKIAIASEKRAVAREKAAKAEAENAQKAEHEQKTKAEEARQKDIAAFVKEYPSINPKDIPQAVWDAVNDGYSLLAAYAIHDNKRLKAEAEAAKKTADNAAKSTGPKQTAGNKLPGNKYTDGFNNDL